MHIPQTHIQARPTLLTVTVGATALVTMLMTTACMFNTAPPPTPEPVTLTYVAIDILDNAEAEVIEQFEMAHPGWEIDRQQYTELPQQYLLSDTPPDLMAIGPSHILYSAGEQGLLTNLTDLWAQAGLDEDYSPAFRRMSESDGKQYFLPTAFSWAGFYYNREIFQKYGLVPPETWNEFLAVAEILRMNGVTPIALAGESPLSVALWFDYLDLRVNGPQFHANLVRGQERYDDERVRNVFLLWESLFEAGYFMKQSADVDDLTAMLSVLDDERDLVSAHKSAMVLADPLALGMLPAPLRGEPGYFRFPIIDPMLPVGEPLLILGYMVPRNAPHAEEAIEFLTYLSTPDVQSRLYQPGESGEALAPISSAVDPGYFTEEIRRRMHVVKKADVVDIPYFLGSPSTMQLAIGVQLMRFVRGAAQGNADIDGVLQALEAARQQTAANGEFIEP